QYMFTGAGITLMFTLLAVSSYLALEPFVRRHWPDLLTSWARLVEGRVLDPRVGRDLLVGVLAGVVYALLDRGGDAFAAGTAEPDPLQLDALLGGRHVVAHLLRVAAVSVTSATVCLLLLLGLRVALRRERLAVAAALLLFTARDGIFTWP